MMVNFKFERNHHKHYLGILILDQTPSGSSLWYEYGHARGDRKFTAV